MPNTKWYCCLIRIPNPNTMPNTELPNTKLPKISVRFGNSVFGILCLALPTSLGLRSKYLCVEVNSSDFGIWVQYGVLRWNHDQLWVKYSDRLGIIFKPPRLSVFVHLQFKRWIYRERIMIKSFRLSVYLHL